MKNRQEAKWEIACMHSQGRHVSGSRLSSKYVLLKVQLVLRQYTQLNLHSSSTGQIGESV